MLGFTGPLQFSVKTTVFERTQRLGGAFSPAVCCSRTSVDAFASYEPPSLLVFLGCEAW